MWKGKVRTAWFYKRRTTRHNPALSFIHLWGCYTADRMHISMWESVLTSESRHVTGALKVVFIRTLIMKLLVVTVWLAVLLSDYKTVLCLKTFPQFIISRFKKDTWGNQSIRGNLTNGLYCSFISGDPPMLSYIFVSMQCSNSQGNPTSTQSNFKQC